LPCPGGRFVVHDPPVVEGDTSPSSGAIIIRGDQIAVGSSCMGTTVQLRATRNGTQVAGRWRSCKGLTGSVRFQGMIDSTCMGLRGVLIAPASHLRRAVSAQASAAGTLRGQIERFVRVAIPPSERSAIVAQRTEIEAQGFQVVENGRFVDGPLTPAAGWLLRRGTSEALTDLNGDFTVDAGVGSPSQGQIFHPSDEEHPIGTFYTVELAGTGEPPAPIVFAILNHGPCAMNAGGINDPPHCKTALGNRSASLLAASVPQLDAGSVDQQTIPADQGVPTTNPPGPAQTQGRLGTYPVGNQLVCADYNGPLGGQHTSVRAFIGSTCHNRVFAGCCENEQADIVRRIANVLLNPIKYPVLRCVNNHKGRFCQEVTPSDVALEVTGTMRDQAGAYSYTDRVSKVYVDATIPPNTTLDITVHNNGCYGVTHVLHPLTAVELRGGVLYGDLLPPLGLGDMGSLPHYQTGAQGQVVYVPDRMLHYRAPACP
jgi:hypothetical protein